VFDVAGEPTYHGSVNLIASRFASVAALGLACIGVIAAACSPTAPPPRAPALRASASAATSIDLVDARWGRFVSKRFDLSMQLPDGHEWRIDDHKTNWMVAIHPGSSSVLRARIWREPSIVGRAACEQRARDWTRDIPVVQDSRVVDRHPAPELPEPGYDTEVVTGVVRAQAASGSADGYVIAFGASMKRCFAVVFTTSARGVDASERLGDRL
jgi:hypothetical protein